MLSVPFWTQGYGFLYLHLREGLSTHTSPLLWMGNCCARRQRPRSYEVEPSPGVPLWDAEHDKPICRATLRMQKRTPVEDLPLLGQ